MISDIKTVDGYIELQTEEVQRILTEIRATTRKMVPQGEEDIRYGMPTLRLENKNLLHFAAFKSHIGFYPTPAIIEDLKDELKPYHTSKGAIQFPLSDEIPMPLIKKIIQTCLEKFSSRKSY